MLKSFNEKNSTSGCAIIVLKGFGGMGKTQLMLRYCYFRHKAYDFVFWLKADSWVMVADSFRYLAINLGIETTLLENDNAEETIFSWVQCWLEENTNWLLLLDNVEEKVAEDIFDRLSRKGGDIIMTSREYIPPWKATIIEIGKMTEEEALALLLQKELGSIDRQDLHFQYVRKVISELDYMPLALDLARAYMEATTSTYQGYLKRLQKYRKSIFSFHDKDIANKYSYSVETVWAISLKRIQNINPTAIKLLEACAFLYPDEISIQLFDHYHILLEADPNLNITETNELKDEDEREQVQTAISILNKFSFISLIPSKMNEKDTEKLFAAVKIHRLVQKVIYDAIER
ncbi:uncharacterized protein VTP21DRAFT_3556 [Calcarisporiella thermophila]|uniref:uncharacterized protein n=1 Tax=Calcarisporiella thermophila TaxID=911321 RepID=UPI003742FE7F